MVAVKSLHLPIVDGLGSALASALPVKRLPSLTTFTQQIALLVLKTLSPLRLPNFAIRARPQSITHAHSKCLMLRWVAGAILVAAQPSPAVVVSHALVQLHAVALPAAATVALCRSVAEPAAQADWAV